MKDFAVIIYIISLGWNAFVLVDDSTCWGTVDDRKLLKHSEIDQGACAMRHVTGQSFVVGKDGFAAVYQIMRE